MVAFDPLTGEERWRVYAGELDEEVGIDPYPGFPLIADGVLYVSSNGFAGAYTVALDAATGAELWKVQTGEFSAEAPALGDGALLVGSDSGDLLALDPATGAERWRVAIPNKIDVDLNQASPALVAGNLIFVRDELGGVVGVQTTD
jgi:outer membrane protein assembly factor BamB